MATPSSASTSIWREKILETANKFFFQIISSFSIIITKIKVTGQAVIIAIRNIEIDPLKVSIEIFHNLFTWFLGSIFALKFTDTGKVFFFENTSIFMALILIKFISFFITLLATLSEMHKRHIVPLVVMLFFEGIASLLAVALISGPALWISSALWICIFGLLGYCCYQEIEELMLNIKRWCKN